MSEGLGFNLCVAPFLTICVPNPELESTSQSWLEFGQRGAQGLELREIGWRLLEGSGLIGYEIFELAKSTGGCGYL